MYARPETEGEVLDFGVSGKLLMNALIMYDRQTESYWSQLLGQAIEGPLAGRMLEPLPSVQTTWEAWKGQHPKTQALQTKAGGVGDPYVDYYLSNRTGVRPEARRDDRLPPKELLAGVVIDGQAVAYPHSLLKEHPVINDTVGDTAVLVVFDPRTETSLLFSRQLAEKTLSFELDPEAAGEVMILTDSETGSKWSAWNGGALEGPLAGSSLERIPSTAVFWFGWKDYYPDTLIYGLD